MALLNISIRESKLGVPGQNAYFPNDRINLGDLRAIPTDD